MSAAPAALAPQLLGALQAPLAAEAAALGGELETTLGGLLRRAQQVTALAAADPAGLVAFLASRLPELTGPLATRLRELRVEDLALAWACSRGDAAAVAAVEARHFDVIPLALSQMPDAAAQAKEITQQLRLALFVGAAGQAPKIVQYAGRGDLRSWLRVVAVRAAVDLLRLQSREVELSDRMLAVLPAGGADPELEHLKRLYQAEFKAAFERAMASLEARERNVLRYHFVEGLNIDEIGALHGVHRATVARWLQKIREALLARTRQELMQGLRVESAELESIMRLIQSQLDASISRLLV